MMCQPQVLEMNEGHAPHPRPHGPSSPASDLQMNEGPAPPGPLVRTPRSSVLTFIAVTDSAKVHIVLVVGEEEEAEPGIEGVDGHDEEDAHDVALFVGAAVAAQMHVDLEGGRAPSQPSPTAIPAASHPSALFPTPRLLHGKRRAPNILALWPDANYPS